MQSVRQFDQDYTDISCHCQKHLPQILRLPLQLLRILITALFSVETQFIQFRNAIHD